MRNLKKILALVLALVMSLSLMATASAAQFPDVDDSNPYKTAIDVLDELKVFQGFEDGTFKPTDTLNRAQAAVLVYRIATGDVEGKFVANYTDMANSKFTDLDGYNWARGYINYCQNAEYVIGTTATTFAPGAKVTGYQLLVMLLRVLGYGKAGEFSDPKGWELQTAAIAEREGILKNVTDGDFHSPAPRQMVAEILFQGLLQETVTHSALTSGGYTKTGETLGKRELGLEAVEGVVVANEWADLYSDSVLSGKTRLEIAEDDFRTLDYSTELTDIGESRMAYIQNGTRVLSIADSGKNKITQGGADVDISSASKFEKVAEMPAASDIEYYVNFGRTGRYTCDYRLEFAVTFEATATLTADQVKSAFESRYVGRTLESIGMVKTPGEETYSKIIRADENIYQYDLDVIYGIFAAADDDVNSNIYQGIKGDVFAGTKSSPSKIDKSNDLSDEISYRTFEKDYINAETYDINWETSNNGEWVKFVDNDGDGKADYAFLTRFWLDKAVTSYKKSGETHLIYNWLDEDSDDYSINWLYEDRALGDVVLCTLIDGVAHVNKADMDTDVIRKVNYKDKDYDNAETVTTTGEKIYEQSGIGNQTGLPGRIVDMAEKTEYNMYFDAFGYLRAYEETAGKQYALVTEAYYTNHNNSAFVQNWPVTVELAIGEEKGMVDVQEYGLANRSGNPLVSGNYWTTISGPNGSYYENYLQPAVGGLDGNTVSSWTDITPTPGSYTYWNWNSVTSQNVPKMATITGAFDYGTQGVTGNVHSASFTNVARYVMDGEDDVNLYSAYHERAYAADKEVDYIQLSTADVKAGAREFAIGGTNAYIAANNDVVNAVHDTQFYIVSEDGVYYFTDYTEVPDINAKTAGGIHAAYAVAQDISSDRDDDPYWVADVIVYEVESWDPAHYDSVALAYFLASKTTGEVQSIEALDNVTEDAKQTIIPGGRGWNSGLTKGFYKVYDQEEDGENTLKASKLALIGYGEYNANGIYAAVADRVYEVTGRGSYVTLDRVASGVPTTIDLAPTYEIGEKDATLLNVFDDNGSGKSGIQKDDRLIWVMNGKNVAYIVNLGPDPAGLLGLKSVDSTELLWLELLFNDIYAEEIDYTLTVAGRIANAKSVVDDWNAWSEDPTDFDGIAPVSSSDIQAAIDDLTDLGDLDPTSAEAAQITDLLDDLNTALTEALLAEAKGDAKLKLSVAVSEAKVKIGNADLTADEKAAAIAAVEQAETDALTAIAAKTTVDDVEAALAAGLKAIAEASVPATTEPITPTPDVDDDGKATVEPIKPEDIQGGINAGEVNIDVQPEDPDAEVSSVTVPLTKETVDKLIEKEADTTVTNPIADVTVPSEALGKALENIEGDESAVTNVAIVVSEVTDEQLEGVTGVDGLGDTVAFVDVSIVVTYEDETQEIADVAGLTNKITIVIDYDAPDNTEVDVYYINGDNELTPIEGTWKVSNKKVTVTTAHLTVFAVAETPVVEPDPEIEALKAAIAAAAVVPVVNETNGAINKQEYYPGASSQELRVDTANKKIYAKTSSLKLIKSTSIEDLSENERNKLIAWWNGCDFASITETEGKITVENTSNGADNKVTVIYDPACKTDGTAGTDSSNGNRASYTYKNILTDMFMNNEDTRLGDYDDSGVYFLLIKESDTWHVGITPADGTHPVSGSKEPSEWATWTVTFVEDDIWAAATTVEA